MASRVRKTVQWFKETILASGSRNWKVVALCFAGATIFWFFNSLGKEYTTRVDYPIRFSYSLEGTTIVGKLPRYVELNVTGGGWTLLQHSFNSKRIVPITLFLENPTAKRYLTRNELRQRVSESLQDLTVNFVLTDTLSFHIEPKISRKVILRVSEEEITYEENYQRTGPIAIFPDTAVITGPESQVNALPDTLYMPLVAEDLDETFRTTIDLDFLPHPELSPSPTSAVVGFPVKEFALMDFSVPLRTIGFPTDSSLYPLDTIVSVLLWLPKDVNYDSLRVSALLYADSISVNDSIVQPHIQIENLPDRDQQIVPQWVRIIRPEQ